MEIFIERSGIVINQNNSSILDVLKNRKIGLIVLLIGVTLIATSLFFKSEVVYLGEYRIPMHQTIDGDLYESAQSKAFLLFNSSFHFSILSSITVFIVGVLLIVGVNDKDIRDKIRIKSNFLSKRYNTASTSFTSFGIIKWYQKHASKHTKTINELAEIEVETHKLQQLKERRREKISNWIWIGLYPLITLLAIYIGYESGGVAVIGMYAFICLIPQWLRDKKNRNRFLLYTSEFLLFCCIVSFIGYAILKSNYS